MRQNILLSFLLIVTSCSSFFSQLAVKKENSQKEIEFEPDTFLLGTFSDYMGRFRYVDREKQIDRYYPYEKPLAYFVEKFIEDHYNIKTEPVFQESGHSEIFNVLLAQQLHSKYYDSKGLLQLDRINTDQKKYSYLTGIFYRYGTHLKTDIYSIRVVNSMKNEDVYQLLKQLKCDRIIYKFYRDHLPASTVFYFKATQEMINYFKLIEKEKSILKDSFQKVYIGAFVKGKEAEKFDEKRVRQEKELISSIEYLFKD